MRKRACLLVIAGLVLFISGKVFAQNSYKIHSHNDYAQELPFWYAYSSGASSIEADIFLRNNELYVAHA